MQVSDFKAYRKAKGLTQKAAADLFNVTQSFISQIEKGTCPIPEKIISYINEDYKSMGISFQPNSNSEGGNMGNYRMDFIPLLPTDAQAGSLTQFSDSVELFHCEKIVSPARGIDFAITISGDSMEPEYPNGSIAFIKRIDEDAFIEWGKVYVLDTCNGSVIKKVMPLEGEPKRVQCISLNAAYPPFDVKMADIFGMFRVVFCMSKK